MKIHAVFCTEQMGEDLQFIRSQGRECLHRMIKHEVKGIYCAESLRYFILVCRSVGRIHHMLFQIFKRAGFQDVNTRVWNGATSPQSLVGAVKTTKLYVDLPIVIRERKQQKENNHKYPQSSPF